MHIELIEFDVPVAYTGSEEAFIQKRANVLANHEVTIWKLPVSLERNTVFDVTPTNFSDAKVNFGSFVRGENRRSIVTVLPETYNAWTFDDEGEIERVTNPRSIPLNTKAGGIGIIPLFKGSRKNSLLLVAEIHDVTPARILRGRRGEARCIPKRRGNENYR